MEERAARFIFVTGGVVSSLGKGIASASLGALLQGRGYKVRIRKLDPYLNVDPGTMSPYQHGECFVTDDGAETDLDLGHYERFTGIVARRSDNITTGQIYWNLLHRERKGEYLGSTVQVIPHVTDLIKDFIASHVTDEDFIICEIGGTVGDIESLPFLEAIRQFGNEVSRDRVCFIHATLLPYIAAASELKTKPTQHSVKELLSVGIQPDILFCRSESELPNSEREKIALFCNVRSERVIPGLDVDMIYAAPEQYHKAGFDTEVLKHFNMLEGDLDLEKWQNITTSYRNPEYEVSIAIVGKYTDLPDAYKSLNEALLHGAIANKARVRIHRVDAEHDLEDLHNYDGILVPGGFGERGSEGKIAAIRYARENDVPFLGICLGMQMAVIETARNLCGLAGAGSSEFGEVTDSVVGLLTEWIQGDKRMQRSSIDDKGGTMRLGAYPSLLSANSLIASIYGAHEISERHRHRYEVNVAYRETLEKAGMMFGGMSPDGVLPETIEIPDHSWFIGVQFHPELKSRPFSPHPLFTGFIEAALKRIKLI